MKHIRYLILACALAAPSTSCTSGLETSETMQASTTWLYRPVVQIKGNRFGLSWGVSSSGAASIQVLLGGQPIAGSPFSVGNVSHTTWWSPNLTPGQVYDYTLLQSGVNGFSDHIRIPDHTSKSAFDFKVYGDSQHRTIGECVPNTDPDFVGCVDWYNDDLLGGEARHHQAVATAVAAGSMPGGPFYKADSRNHPDVILQLGDATTDNQDDSIAEFLNLESQYGGASHSPMYYVLGNHDFWQETLGLFGVYAEPELSGSPDSVLGRDQKFYSFNYNNVHVLVLDTDYSGSIDDTSDTFTQVAFVNADLQTARTDPNVDFIFVAMHRSLFSTTATGDGAFWDAPALIDKLEPLFKQYGVAAVFAGHNHQYQRFDPGYGTPYFIVGTGGGQIYYAGSGIGQWQSSNANQMATSATLGYLNVHIGVGADNQTATATFSFVPLATAAPFAPQAPIDTFTIESRPIGPTGLAAKIAGHQPARTQLSWQDNSTRETGYLVEYQIGNNGSWTTLATLPQSAGSGQPVTYGPFSDPAQGQWVNYRVSALGNPLSGVSHHSVPALVSFRFPDCQPDLVYGFAPDTVLIGSVTLAQGQEQDGQFTVPDAGDYPIYMYGIGDADLYVRRDAAPTLSSYDCRPYLGTADETCVIGLHAGETLYYKVRGYSASSSIQLIYRTPALTGTTNGLTTTLLPSTVIYHGDNPRTGVYTSATSHDYAFALNRNGAETSTLYLRKGAAPTTTVHDCTINDVNGIGSCAMHLDAGQTAYWMVETLANVAVTQLTVNDSIASGLQSRPLLAPSSIATAQSTTGQFTAPKVDDYDLELVGTGNADLYVRKAGMPTTSLYDCRPSAATSKEDCRFHLAAGEIVYWMVRGVAATSTVALAANTGATVHLGWGPGADCSPTGLLRYDVFRSDQSHNNGDFVIADWAKIGEVPAGNPLRFDDSSYSSNGYAVYRVEAVYGTKISEPSGTGFISSLPTDRTKPDLLGANPGMNYVDLSWRDWSMVFYASATGVLLQRSTDGMLWTSVSYGQLANWEGGEPEVRDNTAACGTHYFYRIAYVFADGSRVYSHAAPTTTTICVATPINPSLVVDAGALKLTFSYNGSPPQYWEIWRTDVATQLTTLVTTTQPSQFRDVGASCGKQYSYKARGVTTVVNYYTNTFSTAYGLFGPSVTGSVACLMP